jgi:hypothetical protein
MSFSFNPITGNLDKVNPPVDISGKQDTLVSGTNIKTINSTSLLGSGNIAISAGSSLIIDTKRNILTSTPADPSVALASDTKNTTPMTVLTGIKPACHYLRHQLIQTSDQCGTTIS